MDSRLHPPQSSRRLGFCETSRQCWSLEPAGARIHAPTPLPCGRRHRPAHRITPPPRATRHRVRAHGPPAPARGRGRPWPDTARLCAAAHARATDTNRPAIVAHAATGRADAAEHEHTPGPAAGACRKAGCARRRTLCEGRSLAELEPTPPLAGDRAPGHRTALAEGDGLPPPAHAPCRAEARTEDRHGAVEDKSCVSNQEPWRVSTKNGLDSPVMC